MKFNETSHTCHVETCFEIEYDAGEKDGNSAVPFAAESGSTPEPAPDAIMESMGRR